MVENEILSESCIMIDWSLSSPPIAGEYDKELNSFGKSNSELILTPFSTDFLGGPVKKTAKVMDCAPAGSTALAVVHTMTRVAAVITHPDNVAPADTGTSVPTGEDGPVK